MDGHQGWAEFRFPFPISIFSVFFERSASFSVPLFFQLFHGNTPLKIALVDHFAKILLTKYQFEFIY
jgi:hypothetical protein